MISVDQTDGGILYPERIQVQERNWCSKVAIPNRQKKFAVIDLRGWSPQVPLTCAPQSFTGGAMYYTTLQQQRNKREIGGATWMRFLLRVDESKPFNASSCLTLTTPPHARPPGRSPMHPAHACAPLAAPLAVLQQQQNRCWTHAVKSVSVVNLQTACKLLLRIGVIKTADIIGDRLIAGTYSRYRKWDFRIPRVG